MDKYIVIIPAFNEESTIASVLARIPEFKHPRVDLEVVVIDDGSSDRTADLARKAGATVISHLINQGNGVSLKDGLQYALEKGADITIAIDADGQFDPAEIPQLIAPLLSGTADFCAGDRFSGTDGIQTRPEFMSPIKFWGNQQMTSLINRLADTRMKDVSSGFRAYSREALLNLNLAGKFTITHETILDLGFKKLRLMSVPVNVKYFPERKSRVAGNLFQYSGQALRIIFKAYRDYKPLRFFGYLAMPPMVIGIAGLIFLLIHYILTGDFSPYKFVGFVGIYLFSLGLLLWIIGFLSDILVGIRMTQEKQLYYQKKQIYKK
jgi:glycosyltransferase involved in cell wall biosynthesis